MSRFQVAFDAYKTNNWGTVDTEWKKVTDQYPRLFAGENIGLSVGPGWWVALDNCFKEIDALVSAVPGAVFNAAQIKEKFGGLRFYFDISPEDDYGGDPEALGLAIGELYEKCYEATARAEIAAANGCEHCGEPGTRKEVRGWLRTLCEAHYQELLDRK